MKLKDVLESSVFKFFYLNFINQYFKRQEDHHYLFHLQVNKNYVRLTSLNVLIISVMQHRHKNINKTCVTTLYDK